MKELILYLSKSYKFNFLIIFYIIITIIFNYQGQNENLKSINVSFNNL
jgi:hypothetical protein